MSPLLGDFAVRGGGRLAQPRAQPGVLAIGQRFENQAGGIGGAGDVAGARLGEHLSDSSDGWSAGVEEAAGALAASPAVLRSAPGRQEAAPPLRVAGSP